MNRVKVEDRRYFTYDEKVKILKKSDCKCCHCGKGISVGDGQFTIEHVVPISKGGTNDDENLVALCITCNKEKDNYVISPNSSYYKYLLDEEYKKLKAYYDSYITGVNWFSISNFLSEDKWEVDYKLYLKSASRGRKGMHRAGIIVDAIMVLSKAVYSDLDEVYSFILKYNKSFNIDYDPKITLSYFFEVGAVYILKNKSGEIIAVFPLSLSLLELDSNLYLSVMFNNIITLSNSNKYIEPIGKAIGRILHDVHSLLPENGVLAYNYKIPKKCASVSVAIMEGMYNGVGSSLGIKVAENEEYVIYTYFYGNEEMAGTEISTKESIKLTSRSLSRVLKLSPDKFEEISDINEYCRRRCFTYNP